MRGGKKSVGSYVAIAVADVAENRGCSHRWKAESLVSCAHRGCWLKS